MSHFLVGVFSHDTEDVDDLLAPYNEGNEEYYEFVPATDEEIQDAKKAWMNRFDEDKDDTFEDYARREFGLEPDGNFRLSHYYNPNAKWDWYDADGGRWAHCGMYRLKAGEGPDEFNRVTVGQMDFSLDMDKYRQAEVFWDEYVIGGKPSGDKYPHQFYRPEYYLDRYGTKEKYAESYADVQRPYAFITPDGTWYEMGSMGWFGFDSTDRKTMDAYAEAWKQAVEQHQDCYLTYVDCHI